MIHLIKIFTVLKLRIIMREITKNQNKIVKKNVVYLIKFQIRRIEIAKSNKGKGLELNNFIYYSTLLYLFVSSSRKGLDLVILNNYFIDNVEM